MHRPRIIELSEAQEQELLFEWAARESHRWPELRMMFHIPNGGSRDIREAANLKKQGVKSGVPDIFLAVPRGGYHGLFIEMKRRDGGRLSVAQREWIDALREIDYRVEVCKGFGPAAKVLLEYLNG